MGHTCRKEGIREHRSYILPAVSLLNVAPPKILSYPAPSSFSFSLSLFLLRFLSNLVFFSLWFSWFHAGTSFLPSPLFFL